MPWTKFNARLIRFLISYGYLFFVLKEHIVFSIIYIKNVKLRLYFIFYMN